MKTLEKFSPSTLEHVAICPGWIPEQLPQDSTKAADEGKLMHKAVETGNLHGLNEEQQAAVQMVRKDIYRAVKALGSDPRIFRERWCGIQDFNRGILDLLALAGTKALIEDAKFGRVEVNDAENNAQGISYAVAVFEEFTSIQEIEVRFAQPRCNMLSVATFYRKDYAELLLKLKLIRAGVRKYAGTQDPELLHPNDSNCLYCGNMADCPKLASKALTLSKGYDLLHDRELPDLFDPGQLATAERRAQAETLRKILERWCASVQKHNVAFRLAGEEIPGYELKHRRGDRTIPLPTKAWEVAQKFTGNKLTEHDLALCATISAAKLDEVVAAHFPKGKKAKAKLELEEALVDADAMNLGGESHYLAKTKTK